MILNKAAPLNAEVVMNKNSRFSEKMRFILGTPLSTLLGVEKK